VRRLAILAAALLTVTACRTPAPAFVRLPADDPRPSTLLASWSQAAEARRGLRGRARLSVDGADGAVRLRGKQIVVLERPARLRVEILGLFDQTVAVLVTDGERFELFRSADRYYQAGPVHPDLLWEQAWIALTPAEAIDLLLGVPAPDPSLRTAAALGDGAGGVRLDLADAEGHVRRRARFDAEGRLRGVEVLDPGGALAWQASFDDYASVGGEPFAHAVSLEVVSGDTRAEISLRDVELNPVLTPELFRLREPGSSEPASGQGG
jgi:hypothetical protein